MEFREKPMQNLIRIKEQECYNKGRKPRRKGDKNHGIP